MEEKLLNIEELIPDDKNMNKGTDVGRQLMEKSFSELGAGRSILLDKDNRIIAGNKSTEAAIATGIKKVRVIETTGDELIAVRRIDLELDSAEGRRMALADNATQQANLSWDETQLAAVADEIEGFDPSEWGVENIKIVDDETIDSFFERYEGEKDKNTKKIIVVFTDGGCQYYDDIKKQIGRMVKDYPDIKIVS